MTLETLDHDTPRILLVANTSWYLYNFRRNLIVRLRSEGWCVGTMSPHDEYATRLEEIADHWFPWNVDRAGINPVRDFGALWQLQRVYRRFKPKLIHHFTIKPILYGTLAAKLAGCDYVVNSVTGLGHVFLSERASRRLLRPFIRRWYAWSCTARGTRAIFQNRDDLDELACAAPRLRQSAVLTAGSGVDLVRFQPHPNGSGTEKQALFVGRLLYEKGIAEFVEAARICRERGLAAQFVVCGAADPGNPSAVSEQQLSQWKSQGVDFLGHVDPIEPQLRRADVVVLPSYREGTPRVLLEAAALGKAVVAADTPGCRDVVVHEQTGLLVPPRNSLAVADAIARVLTDDALRQRLGSEGRRRAETTFDERVVIDRTVEVYQHLQTFGSPPRPVACPLERGALVISLDFELAWGTRGRPAAKHIGPYLDGTRAAIRGLLDLFSRYEIPATWAMVGAMLLESPDRTKRHPWLEGPAFEDVPAGDCRSQPHWYASDIVEQILACPVKQELACHTLTHRFVDAGPTGREPFRNELRRFRELFRERGFDQPHTFIYPKARMGHFDVLAEEGFLVYRGPESKWFERLPGERLRAGCRLIDARLARPPVVGDIELTPERLVRVPSSQFYSPLMRVGRWVSVEQRVAKAVKGIRLAAERRQVFHLWCHPFNLGVGTEALLSGLDRIFAMARRMADAGNLDFTPLGAFSDCLPTFGAPPPTFGAPPKLTNVPEGAAKTT